MTSLIDTPDTVRGMAALVTVAEHKSFSAAAVALGLTPSAISKLVSRLEGRVGAKLVNRTTRRVQLTEAGTAYCAGSRRILEDIDGLERELQSRHPVPHGVLRVTAPVVMGQVRVLPILLQFAAQYPDVRLHFDVTDSVIDIIDQRVDVAIRMTAAPPQSFAARWLADDERVLCASPAYLKARGVPREPADLANHDCVIFVAGTRTLDTWNLRQSPARGPTQDVPVRGRLNVSSTLALRDAALAGLGIADLAQYLVEEDLRAGRLVSVLPEFVASERKVYAVYVPSPFIPAKVRLFVAALVDGFAKHEGGAKRKAAAKSA